MLATIEDIVNIIPLYMECLNIDDVRISDNLERFLYKHIEKDIFISCIYHEDDIISMAMLVTSTYLADKKLNTKDTKLGIIKNVYTAEEYRNRRFASGCINELLNYCANNNVSVIAYESDKFEALFKEAKKLNLKSIIL